MDAVMVVNKDANYTSRDIVNIISNVVGTKKVGHTGTLDPMATGVLVVCIGKATKLVDLLTASEKEYVAEVTLGIKTNTLDITGEILEEENVKIESQKIDDVLESFMGSYMQEVPAFAAVKVNGKKLYEYARQGVEIELPKRMVEIKTIERISDIKYINGKTVFKIKTTVSKGTYIRSLVNDIALRLNTIGVMSSLQRTKQGKFTLEMANHLSDIKNNDYKVLSITEALSNIKQVKVDEKLAFKIKNGVSVPNIYSENTILFIDKNNHALALYKNENNLLKAYKVFGG